MYSQLYNTIKWYYASQLLILILGIGAVIRQLGLFEVTRLLLVLSWLSDIVLVAIALLLCRFKLPHVLVPLALLFIGATILGVGNGFLNHTFITDLVTYFTFILKIIIFSNLFQYQLFRNQFYTFIKRYCWLAVIVGSITIGLMFLLWFAGFRFYFSATPDITYSYALALGNGQLLYSYVIMLLGFFSGKRMIIIGLFVIFMFGFKKYLNRPVNYLLIAFAVLILLFLSGLSDLPSVSKITSIIENLNGNNLNAMLMSLDKGRMSEVLGIIHSMNWYDYVLGKGYGFRFFWFGFDELRESGISHSNAHFSPIGIISKFGVLGLMLFIGFYIYALALSFQHRNYDKLSYPNFLFLTSMMVQSLFAYVLFNHPLIPIVFAYVIGTSRKNESIRSL